MFKVWSVGAVLLSTTSGVWAQTAAKPEGTPPKAKASTAATTAKTTKTTTPRVTGTAYIRVLHAIPDGPQVDVYVNGQKTLSSFSFKTVSDYMPIPSGKRSFKIVASGKTDALLEASKTISKDKYYTAVAMGTAAKPTFLLQNESTGKDTAGKARLRAFHLAPEAPAVNITTPSTRSKAGYAKLFSNLQFGKTLTKTVAPGTVTLQVRDAQGKVVREIEGVKLEADKRYAAFAVGTVGGSGARALDVVVVPAAVSPTRN